MLIDLKLITVTVEFDTRPLQALKGRPFGGREVGMIQHCKAVKERAP